MSKEHIEPCCINCERTDVKLFYNQEGDFYACLDVATCIDLSLAKFKETFYEKALCFEEEAGVSTTGSNCLMPYNAELLERKRRAREWLDSDEPVLDLF